MRTSPFSLIKNCFYITITALVLVACSHLDPVSPSSPKSYIAVNNLENEFRVFTQKSSGKSFADKVTLWEEIIESPHQAFYDKVLWRKDSGGLPEEKRLEALKRFFEKYEEHDADILKFYPEFLNSLEDGSQVFKKRFPEFSARIEAYLAPGITWGGSIVPTENGVYYLPLGVDLYGMKKMSSNNKIPSSLIPHELFHAYNMQKSNSNFSEEEWLKKGKLFWQLWSEGIAMYGAHEAIPDLTMEEVMLHPEYLNFKLSPKELKTLSAQFLREFNNPAIDIENPVNFKKWFGGDSSAIKEGLPPAIGYYLGYLVVDHLIKDKKLTIEELSMWSMTEAETPIKETLELFSQ